jgi:diacylglycerol kinase (ATP)
MVDSLVLVAVVVCLLLAAAISQRIHGTIITLPILNTLNDVFQPAGVTWSVSVTNAYGDAIRQALGAAEDRADIVVAYGGDGTVMEVVNGLLSTGVPMGILPGGTGNVLSIKVGIPQTLAEAANVLASDDSVIRQIDVGKCDAANWEDSRYFLLRAATGFEAQRINMTSRELRDKYGRMAYFIGALQAVPESKAVRYTSNSQSKTDQRKRGEK